MQIEHGTQAVAESVGARNLKNRKRRKTDLTIIYVKRIRIRLWEKNIFSVFYQCRVHRMWILTCISRKDLVKLSVAILIQDVYLDTISRNTSTRRSKNSPQIVGHNKSLAEKAPNQEMVALRLRLDALTVYGLVCWWGIVIQKTAIHLVIYITNVMLQRQPTKHSLELLQIKIICHLQTKRNKKHRSWRQKPENSPNFRKARWDGAYLGLCSNQKFIQIEGTERKAPLAIAYANIYKGHLQKVYN